MTRRHLSVSLTPMDPGQEHGDVMSSRLGSSLLVRLGCPIVTECDFSHGAVSKNLLIPDRTSVTDQRDHCMQVQLRGPVSLLGSLAGVWTTGRQPLFLFL